MAAGSPEFGEAVATRALEGHLVAVAAGAAIDDPPHVDAVHRYEAVDALAILEQGLHPAQVAELLLAHGTDEDQVAHGLDATLVQGVDHRQQRRQAPGVTPMPGP